MKKAFLLLFLSIYTVTLLTSITGCSAKPQAVVDELITLLKKGDYEKAQQRMITEKGGISFDTTVHEDSSDIYDRVFKNLEYKILNTSVDGDNAVVKLKTTNLDMQSITQEAMTDIFSRSLTNAFNEDAEEISEEEISKIFIEKMDDPAAQKVIMENDIKLRKDAEDRKWKVVNDSTFINSVTGNLGKSFGDSAQEQDDEVQQDVNLPGSRSNPIETGEAAVVNIQSYSENITGHFEVNLKVTEIIRSDEAWQLIENENMFNKPAPEGKEYMLAKVSAEVFDADTEEIACMISEYDFSFVSSKGATYDNASIVTPDPLQAELYKGGKAEGYVPALIDIGDTVDMKYEGFNTSTWFKLGS